MSDQIVACVPMDELANKVYVTAIEKLHACPRCLFNNITYTQVVLLELKIHVVCSLKDDRKLKD
ncbi:hypothetical protein E2C01_013187 [Portunus trituberculatus]|uniref:Uncharacterized protein n=1 Tax=Portunus trituberculatus TaxID=210409 RepID=A0A5B7DFK1_PORTR|nr:hypothetical protein [Portunus trituberculatus]